MTARCFGVSVASVLVAVAAVTLAPPSEAAGPASADGVLGDAQAPAVIVEKLQRYVDVNLGLTGRRLDPALTAMLAPLRAAADAVDAVYWQQRSPAGWEMLQALGKSKRADAKNLGRLLSIHYGPWDWHANDEPFIGRLPRPPGVAFYPTDTSRREIDAFVRGSTDVAGRIWDPYTVVVRRGDGLDGIPYSQAYAEQLGVGAAALTRAARAYKCVGADCPCAGLARFLDARAKSFGDDDYRSSETLWLDTGTCPLDVAIGPYEFYEDRLMGLKAAYETVIYYRDEAESARYQRLLEHHEAIVAQLPLSSSVKDRFRMVRPSPITIADVLYTSGDARAGYQIRAFILPNDPVVREAKGTKNVILRNAVKARFDKLVQPIAERIFDGYNARRVTFNAYYDFLLAWQMAHAVVPGEIPQPGGVATTAKQQLRSRFTFINAVKGEVVALLNYLALLDRGVVRAVDEEDVIATYLAGLFDSARLAADSPQTIAKAIVYNYLAQEWVFRYDPRARRFEVNAQALRKAARQLAAEVLQVLGRGDYGGAGNLIVQYGILPGEVHQKLAELHDLPRDIVPRYSSMPGADK